MSHHVTPSHRRGFLRNTLGACWTTAALLEQSVFRAAQARAQANPGLPSLFDIKKVADGIYAAIGRPTTLINCNAAIFEMSDGLLVVDSHSKPSAVYSLAAQIKREVSKKPVKYLVNSHFHWDHSQGNAAFKKVHPQAMIVSSVGTWQLLSEQATLRLKGSLEETAATIDQMKDKLGKTSNAEDKKFLQAQINEAQSYLAEMKSYTPEIPTITVGRDLVLHDEMHDLHLAFRGRAHTAGDISVFCPQKKVIATGDMLHGFQPWFSDAYPYEWPKTLYTFAELDFNQVIGGHADVQQGKGRLYNKAGFIEELLERVTRSRFESKEQLKRDLKPSALKSLQRDGYGSYIAENLRRYTPVLPSQKNVDNLPGLVEACIDQMLIALKREA
jgi:cyclase